MNDKRKKVEAYVLDIIQTMDTSGTNTKLYKDMFASMDDNAFDNYMKTIRDGKRKLELIVPNLMINLRIKNLLKAAKKVNIEIFERLKIWDPATEQYYITPKKYMVIRIPIRRVKQFLMDKISIPEGDTKTDLLTGQVIKPDKGSSVSLVETQTMLSKGLDKSVVEFLAIRGGNPHAYAEYKSRISETGQVNLSDISASSTNRSAVVASVYLKGMHIDNNLVEGM